MRAPSALCAVLYRLLSIPPLAGIAGCAGWSQIPRPAPTVLPEAKELQVWRSREAIVLRQVTIGADSVSGVRTDHWPRCDSCRVAVAQAEIDSFRLKPEVSTNPFGSGMVLGLLAGALITFEVFKATGGT